MGGGAGCLGALKSLRTIPWSACMQALTACASICRALAAAVIVSRLVQALPPLLCTHCWCAHVAVPGGLAMVLCMLTGVRVPALSAPPSPAQHCQRPTD